MQRNIFKVRAFFFFFGLSYGQITLRFVLPFATLIEKWFVIAYKIEKNHEIFNTTQNR